MKFVRNGVAGTLFFNLIHSASAGGQTVITARMLGASGRGALVLYITIASFAMLIGSLGTNTAGRYLLAVDGNKRVDMRDYLALSVVLSSVTFALGVCATRFLLPLAGAKVGWPTTLLVGAFATALLLGLQLADALHAGGRHTVATQTVAVPALGGLVATALLAARGDRSEVSYLLVLVGSAAGQAFLGLAVLGWVRPRADGLRNGSWRRMLHLGTRGIGINLGQSLTFRLDRYLLSLFISPAAVGIYSVAATIPELLRLLPYSTSQIVLREAATDAEYLTGRYQRRRRRTITLQAVAALAVAIAAPWMIPAIFGESFHDAVEPLLILLVAELFIGRFFLDSRCLTGRGELTSAAQASLIGLGVVLALDLALIPTTGIAGAAWASAAAYLSMATASQKLLRRSQKNLHPITRRRSWIWRRESARSLPHHPDQE